MKFATVNMSTLGHQQMALIRRSQHNMKLANSLNDMLQRQSLVDVTLHCDDGEVVAHKLVLAASSAYFRNLFSRMTHAFHYPIIVLRGMSLEDLRIIIQFIYHGEIQVAQNRVESLMRCANYLQIDGMESSANSLNAVLASSSSMPHHAILTGPLSASTTTNTNSASTTKTPQQYPPATTNHKQARGHGSRHNNNNNNNNNSNNSSTTNTANSGSGKPKHTCDVCLKTFTHGFTLKRHMKLHSQSRDAIYCDLCSKSYSCRDSFLRHKKSSGHLQHAEYRHNNIDVSLNSGR